MIRITFVGWITSSKMADEISRKLAVLEELRPWSWNVRLKLLSYRGRIDFSWQLFIPEATIDAMTWYFFCVTGSLGVESTGHRWVPLKGPVTRSFDASLMLSRTNCRGKTPMAGNLGRHDAHVTSWVNVESQDVYGMYSNIVMTSHERQCVWNYEQPLFLSMII